MRVALVGLGPRGLFALERLVHHAAADRLAVEVDAYEPHPAPGAGPHYDPAQAAFLRMNLSSGAVALWPAGTRCGPSFVEWAAATGTPVDPDHYAPRALVGEYLADGLARVSARAARAGVAVRVRAQRVDGAVRADAGWAVHTAGPGPAVTYDEVLLCTGHAPPRPGAGMDPSAAAVAQGVYPVLRLMGEGVIPAGAQVAVRGMALTFLDAALALTEGRGGRFVPGPAGAPHRPRYRPSGREPAVILPFARGGRVMPAKPSPALTRGNAALVRADTAGRAAVSALPAGAGVAEGLVHVLARAAAAALHAVGAAPVGTDPLARRIAGLMQPDSGSREDPAAELERSILVGHGRRSPGPDWALGHAWRALYPAIVERMGGDGLSGEHWPAMRALEAGMERVAFGPGLANAERLLALMRHGLVDTAHAEGGVVRRAEDGRLQLVSAAGAAAVDHVVDAVLAPPGAEAGDPLLDALLAAGTVRRRPGRRGLDILPDGRCRDAAGRVQHGLAVVGRATEDVVIGNDTLSRDLHPALDLWAAGLVARRAGRSAARLSTTALEAVR